MTGAADPGMDILYRDDYLVAVNKPAGLLVHRTSLDRHAATSALQLLRNQLGRHVYPVHRLDRPTSGVLLFGLSPGAARSLAAEFAERRVSKTYVAVVRGWTAPEGTIDHPMEEEKEAGQAAPVYRESVTRFRRLAVTEVPFPVGRYATSRYSLVRMSPLTGRRHQLRRHCKHILHPIIGDTHYGEGRHNRLFRSEFNCSRLLLAAVELSLQHPATAEPVTVRAPLDDEFECVVRRLGWSSAMPAGWLRQQER